MEYEFQLIIDYDREDFEKKVALALNNHWSFHGDLKINQLEDATFIFTQAMYRG